jgi:hypothetical protein
MALDLAAMMLACSSNAGKRVPDGQPCEQAVACENGWSCYQGVCRKAGAAYLFRRSGDTWDTGTKLVANDAQADDNFGYSVAISGDYPFVGAHGVDDGSGSNLKKDAGAAYVYEY